jgi:uncharacterized protein
MSWFTTARYLSLETFRRDGRGVRTPVWFAPASEEAKPVLYAYTLAQSGKAKRIRRSGHVRIAPCDMRGRITGDWQEATARIAGPDAYATGMRLINRRYWPWKSLMDLSVRFFHRQERVVIVIHPA